jgi:hypothetical protein
LSIVKSGGSQYQITALVKAGTTPLSGKTVSFTVQSPTGKVTSYSAVTKSGAAKVTVRLKSKDPKGTYTVNATV